MRQMFSFSKYKKLDLSSNSAVELTTRLPTPPLRRCSPNSPSSSPPRLPPRRSPVPTSATLGPFSAAVPSLHHPQSLLPTRSPLWVLPCKTSLPLLASSAAQLLPLALALVLLARLPLSAVTRTSSTRALVLTAAPSPFRLSYRTYS